MHLWLLLCSLLAPALLFAVDLEQVREAVRNKRLGWTPKATEISETSSEDQLKLLGSNDPSPADYFEDLDGPRRATKLPEAFDWRDVSGVSYISPVHHQGRCGSCVSFATVATLEAQLNIAHKSDPSVAWSFSPQHLFACGGGICGYGWHVENAVAHLIHSGVPDSACYPYYSGATGVDYSCSSTCSDWNNRSKKILSAVKPTDQFSAKERVKSALLKGPLIATMTIYEDFMYFGSGVYKYAKGRSLGSHAVMLIGWSDKERAWIGKNSWGTGWGEKGFFKAAWDDVTGLGNSTWSLEVPKAGGSVYALGLAENAYLRGKVQWAIVSTHSDGGDTGWELIKASVPVAEGGATSTWNSEEIPDGSYLLIPYVRIGDVKRRGQPRTVHVLNGKPDAQITITYPPNRSLLRGKTETHFVSSSQPVPFSQFTLWIREKAPGKKAYQVKTTNVAASLASTWTSNTMPNGEYVLTIEGSLGSLESVVSKPVEIVIKN